MKQRTIYGEYGLEGPIPEEKKKSKRAGSKVLTAVGIGVAAIAILGILYAALPAIGNLDSGNPSPKAGAAPALPSQLSAKISGSSVVTISDYYTDGYNSGLQCLVDSFPIYCDGSPITIQGFPPGMHTLSVTENGHLSSLEFQIS